MSLDLLKKLAVALVAVVFLWGAAEILRGDWDAGTADFELTELTVGDVDSIVIAAAEQTVRLVPAGTTWTVNGHRATPSVVPDLVNALNDTERVELVASNPNSHSRFEIEDDAAKHLMVWQGGATSIDLLIGKRGRSFQNVYLRRPGEDDVYQAESRLSSFVERRLADWRDKAIAAVEPDSIASFAVRVGRGGYDGSLADGAWTFGDGATADSAKVQRFLNRFRALNGTGFAEASDTTDFDSPDRSVVLRNAAQDVLLEIALDSADVGYWVRRTGDDVIFQLPVARGEQLAPDREDLEPDAETGN